MLTALTSAPFSISIWHNSLCPPSAAFVSAGPRRPTALTSAPFSISIWHNSLCPPLAAFVSAVPSMLTALTSAPFSISSWHTSLCPFFAAAISAVIPSCFFALTSAIPSPNKYFIASFFPNFDTVNNKYSFMSLISFSNIFIISFIKSIPPYIHSISTVFILL